MNLQKILLFSGILIVAAILAALYLQYSKLSDKYIINKTEGTVTVQKQGNQEVPAKKYDEVKPGDVITTQNNSKADVIFKKTANSRLKGNTALEVDKDSPEGTPRTKLAKGAVLSDVNKKLTDNLKAKTKVFSVQTPQVVAGVRGTSFLVKYVDELPECLVKSAYATKTAVLEGTVNVFVTISSVEMDVTNGEKAVVCPNSGKPKLSPLSGEDKKELEEIAEISKLSFPDFASHFIADTFDALWCYVLYNISRNELGNILSAMDIYAVGHNGKVPDKFTELQMSASEFKDICGIPYLYKKYSPTSI
ncbi:MAG: FecR family protein [Nitrospirota bacterium]